jgi:hypothetical protein
MAVDPDLNKGAAEAVAAAAAVMAGVLRRTRRTMQVIAAVQTVAAGLAQLAAAYHNGETSLPGFVDTGTALMAEAYADVMAAGSSDAAADLDANTVDVADEAAARADRQRGFLMGLLKAVIGNDGGQGLERRFDQYGQTVTGAYNAAYGQTAKADDPDYEIVWELGEAEHCPKCLERAGKSFTFATLPGWPGDGDFGGDICDGGPKCACSLSFRKGGVEVSRGENTQRANALEHYPQQLEQIQQRRADDAARRQEFVDGLPGSPDITTTQGRALLRDQLRQQVADLANARLRAQGGYQGVTFEPSDVSAHTIAALLPDAARGALKDAGHITLEEAVDQLLGKRARGHGNAERLHEYWVHGEGAAKIKWGEPGDFDRCVMHLGKYVEDPKGYCAQAHHDALGIWPATHAKEERDG